MTDHLEGVEAVAAVAAAAAATGEQEAEAIRALRAQLRTYSDFPLAGVDFVDVLPLLRRPQTHAALMDALAARAAAWPGGAPDVVVALDARGFLFGPTLALRLGCGFAAVRKRGKLPGACVRAAFDKEYGADGFEMQTDAVAAGQRVLVVDDVVATGGSAQAAGRLVTDLGGVLLGFLFLLEIGKLRGRDKLDAPVVALLGDA
jgi:adenine phosphoribosyltransferase